MIGNNVPGNTTVEEVIRMIEDDPKATDREKYLAQYMRNGDGRQNFGHFPLQEFHRKFS